MKQLSLLFATSMSFYGMGLIMITQIYIYKSWVLIKDNDSLDSLRLTFWEKLPYIFAPVGILIFLNIFLLGYHPVNTPPFLLWLALVLILSTVSLTGLMWGRWQSRITFEHHRTGSPLLAKLIETHWIRVLLVASYVLVMFIASAITFAKK